MICEYFGWEYDYLVRGVSWSTVVRMLIDAPATVDKDEEDEEITLTNENAQQIAALINRNI